MLRERAASRARSSGGRSCVEAVSCALRKEGRLVFTGTHARGSHRGELLQVLRTSLSQVPRRFREVMSAPRTLTQSASRSVQTCKDVQRLAESGRVFWRAELVDELEDALDIGIYLEYLEGKGGLCGGEGGVFVGY